MSEVADFFGGGTIIGRPMRLLPLPTIGLGATGAVSYRQDHKFLLNPFANRAFDVAQGSPILFNSQTAASVATITINTIITTGTSHDLINGFFYDIAAGNTYCIATNAENALQVFTVNDVSGTITELGSQTTLTTPSNWAKRTAAISMHVRKVGNEIRWYSVNAKVYHSFNTLTNVMTQDVVYTVDGETARINNMYQSADGVIACNAGLTTNVLANSNMVSPIVNIKLQKGVQVGVVPVTLYDLTGEMPNVAGAAVNFTVQMLGEDAIIFHNGYSSGGSAYFANRCFPRSEWDRVLKKLAKHLGML